MHLYHIINQFDQVYGKKHKRIDLSLSNWSIYARIIYDDDESIVMRVWINKIKPEDPFDNQFRYEYILWKDAIYSNDIFMPDPENLKHVYETVQSLTDCKADLIAGKYDIDPPDNKLLRILYQKNRQTIEQTYKYIKKYDVFDFVKETPSKTDNFFYEDALKNLPFHIEMEKLFGNIIKERNLPKIPKKRKAVN